jgi:hypothetical protein
MINLRLRVTILDENGTDKFALDYGLPRLDIEELRPLNKAFMDPADYARELDCQERLRRYTDLMAAHIAHSFTEYMLKEKQ